MRYAVLSDLHANLPALRAVLVEVSREGVDDYLCLGDLVGYGPQPNECVELVADFGMHCVAGNHDLIAVGSLTDRHSGVLARQTLAWTRGVLTEATRAFLRALPQSTRVDGWELAHGSPDDPEEYVRSADRAGQLLYDLDASVARGLLLGHTHQQWAVAERDGELLRSRAGVVPLRSGQRHVLNPGSVGQSRNGDELARYLLIDTVEATATFRAVAYDVRSSATALRAAGLPVRALFARDKSLHELVLGARRRIRSHAERLRQG